MTDFLRNFFMAILFTLRVFARNLLREEVAEEIFFIFMFLMTDLGYEPRHFVSNKPAHQCSQLALLLLTSSYRPYGCINCEPFAIKSITDCWYTTQIFSISVFLRSWFISFQGILHHDHYEGDFVSKNLCLSVTIQPLSTVLIIVSCVFIEILMLIQTYIHT